MSPASFDPLIPHVQPVTPEGTHPVDPFHCAMGRCKPYWLAACQVLTWVAVLATSHVIAEEEILFGASAAGQLKVDIGFAQPFALPVSIFPGISGYATGAMGMHSTILNDTSNDFYELSTAADFRLILLGKDAGMEVWNDHGSDYMTNGESFYVGPPPFDTHPVWNLVSGVPGNAYSLTLKFHDLNGVYPDSDPFVLSFTAEAAPGPFELGISRTDSAHVTISWPTNALGWALESFSVLGATNWTRITNAPSQAGTNFALTFGTSAGPQFFRLHQQ